MAGGGAVSFTVRRRRRRDGTTPTCTRRAWAWPLRPSRPPAGAGDAMRRGTVGGGRRPARGARRGGRASCVDSWLVPWRMVWRALLYSRLQAAFSFSRCCWSAQVGGRGQPPRPRLMPTSSELKQGRVGAMALFPSVATSEIYHEHEVRSPLMLTVSVWVGKNSCLLRLAACIESSEASILA